MMKKLLLVLLLTSTSAFAQDPSQFRTNRDGSVTVYHVNFEGMPILATSPKIGVCRFYGFTQYLDRTLTRQENAEVQSVGEKLNDQGVWVAEKAARKVFFNATLVPLFTNGDSSADNYANRNMYQTITCK